MITGIIIGILICVVVSETYMLLRPKEELKEVKQKLTKEQKEKKEKIQKAFNNLMEYDYMIASKRRDN